MANTLFGAMSGVRPVSWVRLIQEYVKKSLPHIGRKPSFLSPYILHLYQQHRCVNEAGEDMLTIAEVKVVYKLGPVAEMAETETEDSSNTAVPEPTPISPPLKIRYQLHHHHDRKPDPAKKFPGRISTFRPLSFWKPPSSASRMS